MVYKVHFFLGAVGLVALLSKALQLWGMEIPWLSVDFGIYKYIWINRTKPLDLILHVGGVVLLVLYFAVLIPYFRYEKKCSHSWKHQSGWILLIAGITVYLVWWNAGGIDGINAWFSFIGLTLLWSCSVSAPFYGQKVLGFIKQIDWKKQWASIDTGRVYILLIILSLGQLFWALSPFTAWQVQLLNEFLEIPTNTLLFETKQDVTNQLYYDTHQLMGPAQRYLPERDRGRTPQISPEVCTTMNPVSELSIFLEEESNRNSFAYDVRENRLCAVDLISPEQWLRLRGLESNADGRRRLDEWYASISDYGQKLQKKGLSREEKQFFRVNQFTLGFQLAGNGVIHHHGFLLSPLNEYDLGKPREEIFAQYGWLNLWLTHRLMRLFGDIDYQTYFKVWYSYYYLYYLLYFILLWLIFRHKGYLAAGALLSIGLLCLIDFQWLLQPPGINPIRRIMELPLLACLFLYWQNQRRLYLMLAIFALWLSIINNWQFGLMALLAAGLALALYERCRDKTRHIVDVVIMFIGLVGSIALLLWMRGSPDPLSSYYLAGAAAIPSGPWKGLRVLIVFGLASSILVSFFDRNKPLSYMCAFLLFYTSEVMTYSLWNGSPTYLLVPGPLYVLVLLAFAKHCEVYVAPTRSDLYDTVSSGILVCAGIAMFVAGSWNQDKTRNEFLGLLESHKTYEWNLERAQIASNMDPRYFEDGVALIQKYSTEPGIYIVSKYDNFIPFLARRYSAMPYFEVSKFLASPREMAICIDKLRGEKPPILFVDTDIQRDFATDIVHQQAPLGTANAMSRYHVEQMRNLQKVFFAVQDEYELVEQGLLISVYRRK